MDVANLLRDLGVDYKTPGQSPYVSHGWVGIACPFCDRGNKRPGLGINLTSYRVSCWKCGGHSLISVLSAVTGLPFPKVKELAGSLHRVVPADLTPRGVLRLPAGVGPLLPAHKSYLKARGFDPDELARRWGVQGIGPSHKLQWRLFLPVTLDGEVVSWTTRAVSEEVPLRYVSAKPDEEKYRLKELLFGEDLVPGDTVVVNEGPLDALAVGPGGVATCGVGVTKAQLLRIAKFPVRVVAPDNEPAARKRARKLCRDLAAFPGETYMIEWSGKDASRSPAEEVREVRTKFLGG